MIFKIQQRKRNSDNKYGFKLERKTRCSTHKPMQKNIDSEKFHRGEQSQKWHYKNIISTFVLAAAVQQHAAYCKARAKEWVRARWITRGRKRRLAACLSSRDRIYYKHLCPRTKNTKNTGLFPHAVNGTGDHKAGESRRQRPRRVRGSDCGTREHDTRHLSSTVRLAELGGTSCASKARITELKPIFTKSHDCNNS